ncbi:MAG: hypothetical protein EOP11_01550 [Proteobacteria bacterium]|nr:MAG: hypothetical protein EOP11_01550 [Pseudomonadota bacterium]
MRLNIYRFKTHALALLAAAIPLHAAHAACSEVRLDQADGSMARIPVLHQDGTETCYAYAAAQMADALRHRKTREFAARGEISPAILEQQLRHITSPLVAAVNSAYSSGAESVNQGLLADSLKSIFAEGSCSHERIGDEFGAYDSKGFLAQLKGYFDGMRARRPGTPIARPPSPLDCCTDSRDPGAPLSRRNLEKYLAANTFVGFLKQSFDAACKNRWITVPSGTTNTFYGVRERSPSARMRRFSEALYSIRKPSDMPVGINFCADVLFDRTKVGVDSTGQAMTSSPSPLTPPACVSHHSALVVGRRPGPGGTCQFLIRNSFGDSNNGYDWEARRGQVWVDEAALVPNLTGTVVLE